MEDLKEKSVPKIEVFDSSFLRRESAIKQFPTKVGVSELSDFNILNAIRDHASLYTITVPSELHGPLFEYKAVPAYSFDKELCNKVFFGYYEEDGKTRKIDIVVKDLNEYYKQPIAIEVDKTNEANYELFFPSTQSFMLLLPDVFKQMKTHGLVIKYVAIVDWK